MRRTTLCFLVKDDKVLLAMKKRGFGSGKWNGVGGKAQEGEDIKATAIREVHEEIGVTIPPGGLEEAGTLDFRFVNHSDWNNACHVFIARMWSGELAESEEMRPAWYSRGELPFDSMWIDDPHWLPQVLAGKKVKGGFLFDERGEAMLECNVKELS